MRRLLLRRGKALASRQAEAGELFPDLAKAKLPKRGKHYIEPRGHAFKPGTGPSGETCGGCRHAVRLGLGKKRWFKCRLSEAAWTHTRRTDIRARDAACRLWEPWTEGE